MALILGRIGTFGKLYWFMPPSANLALRELGIVMFLAVVGLNSGGGFIDTLIYGQGVKLDWLWYRDHTTPIIDSRYNGSSRFKLNYLYPMWRTCWLDD